MPVILERDRAQAETVFSLETYVSRRLTPKFLKLARESIRRPARLLDEVGATLRRAAADRRGDLGVESNYGRFSGVRPTITALATLAWDPRRATFFRGELFNALEILNRGDIEFARMRGFMGRRDGPGAVHAVELSASSPRTSTATASATSGPHRQTSSRRSRNYLKGRGWRAGETWGREVNITPEAARTIVNDVERRNGTCQATRNMTGGAAGEALEGTRRPLAQWKGAARRSARRGARVRHQTALPRVLELRRAARLQLAPTRTRSRSVCSDRMGTAPAAATPAAKERDPQALKPRHSRP